MDESDLRVDGVPHVTSLVSVDNVNLRKHLENHHFCKIFHLPQVLSRHGDVVVNVAGDLLVVRGHGSRHVVRVESSVSETMNQLNDVTMLDPVQRLLHCQVLSVNQSKISFVCVNQSEISIGL